MSGQDLQSTNDSISHQDFPSAKLDYQDCLNRLNKLMNVHHMQHTSKLKAPGSGL